MLKLPCKFSGVDEFSYSCNVTNQYIPDDKIISKFDGELPQNFTNANVSSLTFTECIVPRIPCGISIHFENITQLSVSNCQLKDIQKDDLKGLKMLSKLNLSKNNLEFLPGDLFKYTPGLRNFDCSDNKIKYIEPELLDNFSWAECINFKNNVNINLYCNRGMGMGQKFDDFKQSFKLSCIKLKHTEHQKVLADNEKLSAEVLKLTALTEKLEKGISDDINAMLKNEELKDFVIKVGESEFKAHKFILIARSSTFAEMVKNNPDADNMELKDISEGTFKEVLNFIYSDKEPSVDADMKEIFGAASKLNIVKLMEIGAKKLIAALNSNNYYESLILGHKYEHEELKQKSFAEIKKIIPNVKNEMINEPEKLKVLIEAWRELEGN